MDRGGTRKSGSYDNTGDPHERTEYMIDVRSTLQRLLGTAAVLLIGLLGVLALRAWSVESRQVSTETADVDIPSGIHERLARSLRFRTITKRDPARLDSTAFHDLFAYFERTFPNVHDSLHTRQVNKLSRLYKWEGRDPSLAPIVLMAHTDVVPVEDSSDWTHAPFAGRVADGYVWGRGALDDKTSLVGILQAIELLLERGIAPRRTVYVAFGHDEEVGGQRGGRVMARHISRTDEDPALVVDEGGAITRGTLPGVDDPVAVVGVAGKGYLSVQLEATGPGGHSSIPPDETSIEVLNEAVRRLLDNPMPSHLSGVTGTMFDYLAPEMDPAMRTIMANKWLTAPILRWVMNNRPSTRAAIRTTMAPTKLDAGVKDNVIPTRARAIVNYRILPSESVENVMNHVRSTVDGLPIDLNVKQSSNPSPVSTVQGPTFQMLQRTIGEVTADSVIVAPYLVPGTTDSRYYADDSDFVYRFLPYVLSPDDRGRIHGLNERISIEDYRTVVRFYIQLIQNVEQLSPSPDETE